MSIDGGNSWSKQSDAVSGGTGPHYYQELYASPHVEGRLYLMNNTALISDDHGKTFRRMNERAKHVDNHAIAFKMSDPEYVVFGTDGGLYESYDHTETWRFIKNLPITQYYKVAVDDSEPFYNIYGGTQDNGSHGGPSRTTAQEGIRNGDWWKTLGADGHQSAVEPGNPDITYGEFQQGVLFRIDQTTGETVAIQPQPGEGEPYERFNWDAPILVSPHKPSRIYFASYRVWKSDDRGDSWIAISKDLTRNQERITLPIMGRTQSWDNAWDVGAMSNYNTITSLAESPKQEGLIYAGTDDGIIQVTEDGGANWRKVELGSIKGVPSTAFVNDVRADLFDANVVYAALDNHKYGDYKPYLIKSTNKGRSWSLMNGDLPQDNLLTWRLVQDHIKKEVMFLAAEYGIYFTYDGGSHWVKLTGGLPTISFRDITIQRREDDLVGASFGRGFFVLDDITPLRNWDKINDADPIVTFKTKPALWYAQRSLVGSQGNTEFEADNPPYGAVFTYYLKESFNSKKQERKKKEGDLNKSNANIPFPGWAALEVENRQEGPTIILTVKDNDGNVVNQIMGSNRKGFNRANWNLQYASRGGVTLQSASRGQNFFGRGPAVTPGNYTYTISKIEDGVISNLTEPQSFEVKRLFEGALEGASYEEINAFRVDFENYSQKLTETNTILSKHLNKVSAMKIALGSAPKPSNTLYKQLEDTRIKLLDIQKELSGDRTKGDIGERSNPTASDGMRAGFMALGGTYGPTPNHKKALNRAANQLDSVKQKLDEVVSTFATMELSLKETGAPWVEK